MTKDKKQMLVLGVLVLVVLAVGAFQFMGPKPAPVDEGADAKKDKADETLVATEEQKDPMKLYIDSLIEGGSAPRDPFTPQAVLIDEPEDQGTSQNLPQDHSNSRPPIEITGDTNPYPLSMNNGGPQNPGTTVIEPAGPAVDPNALPYALRGVLLGKRKMCMIETTDGRQILAVEGQRFGNNGETTVVEITEHHVVFNHRGKVKTLALLGGN